MLNLPAFINGMSSMSNQSFAHRAASVLIIVALVTACSSQSSTAASAEPLAQAPSITGTTEGSTSAASSSAPQTYSGRAALPDFASLVERFGPSVVNVAVVGKRQTVNNVPGMSEDDPFNEFFRRFGMPAPGQGQRGRTQPAPRGEGSGFIVSADGYILTNAHVVDDASEVTVKLTDRREFSAKVIGFDKRTDVAVLKIDAKNLPVVRIGDPSRLRAGEWVIAIGSPFGFDNSVTAGIVSAKARALPGEEGNYVPFIQTDVAVNPGNSGGPLFNLDGEVVGINSQIYSRTGGYMGLSFAIPIDIASGIKDQLVKTGKVSRGRIGVSIQDVNAQFAESFGLDRPHGALVGSVESGGPADKAGVKAGDIILKAAGKVIDRSTELPAVIAALAPGSDVDLEVWRDRSVKKLNVKIIALQEQAEKVALNKEPGTDSSALGLSVRPLTSDEQKQVGTTGTLVVEQVDGPAEEAGVQPGDVILGVNGARVKTSRELQDAAKKGGKTVALLIQRENAQIFVPIRIG